MRTAPAFSILSSDARSAFAASGVSHGAYCFLPRIVMFYNEFGRSQYGSFLPFDPASLSSSLRVVPANAGTHTRRCACESGRGSSVAHQ